MNEHAPAAASEAHGLRSEPTAGDPRRQRRRRTALRHHTAVVVAEIRRMRRAGWSDASDRPGPRVAV